MSRTRTYKIWSGMVTRVEDPSTPKDYDLYAGRGITISPELRTFEGFFAVLGTCPPEMTLDRRDTNGNYSAENVRWADAKTQARNRRSNTLLTYDGKTQTLVEWSEELGIPYARLCRRVTTYHWPAEKALLGPRYTHANHNPAKGKSRPQQRRRGPQSQYGR